LIPAKAKKPEQVMQPYKILVVEDDRDIRESLRDLLEMEGFEVVIAAEGIEAFEELRKASDHLPDLIILDLMMPGMDGYQFRELQKADPQFSKVPVLLMTADGNIDIKKMKVGAKMAIRKPLEISDLLEVIRTHFLVSKTVAES
jgi:two-component system chemotaxis response regulator CheY